jgi:hypothetical protein
MDTLEGRQIEKALTAIAKSRQFHAAGNARQVQVALRLDF